MTLLTGSVVHPEGEHVIAPSTEQEIDDAVADLKANKTIWRDLAVEDRMFHLEQVIANTLDVSEDWVRAACEAKGIPFDAPVAGEEWSSGPYLTIRNARLLRSSLAAIADGAKPPIPNVDTRANGQVVAKVFPTDVYDQVLWAGFTGEVWMQPRVTPGNLAGTQAVSYTTPPEPRVGLILGAGNIASIPAMDTLTKLIIEKQVVLLKMNPVNEYLGPFIAAVFASLIEEGFMRIIYGGADQGAYAVEHSDVDTIHMTGSDKTFDAIVFGTGDEGRARKEKGEPRLPKPISSELGNVTPVIVVPGPWTDSDIEYQAKHLAGMLTHNAGFNCIAARVLVTHEHWKHREALIDRIGETLKATPTRPAYYPGAHERMELFLGTHPDGRRFGDGGPDDWAFITNLDEHRDDVCFSVEAFAGVFSEVPLDAPTSVPEFLAQAVAFCNESVWGTLGASIIVHPTSMKDPAIAAAVEQAIADLRYGTIGLNAWAGIGYLLTSTPWGGYPGQEVDDIQSGNSFVHNTYMFDQPQKSVVRAPFRTVPKPLWFAEHKRNHDASRHLTAFEADPQPWKLVPVLAAAARG